MKDQECLTETGLSVGTPLYMNSDQATGYQVVGTASNTYALARVFYEMSEELRLSGQS